MTEKNHLRMTKPGSYDRERGKKKGEVGRVGACGTSDGERAGCLSQIKIVVSMGVVIRAEGKEAKDNEGNEGRLKLRRARRQERGQRPNWL